jgi:hypothetical protein
MPLSAQIVLDTADIVRDGDVSTIIQSSWAPSKSHFQNIMTQRMGVQLLAFSSQKDVPEHALRLEAQNGKSGLRQPSLAEPT